MNPVAPRAWCQAWNESAELRELAADVTLTFALSDGTASTVYRLDDAVMSESDAQPAFTLCAAASDWREFFAPLPDPNFHHWFAMTMRRGAEITGDELCFAQHVHIVRRFLELGRSLSGTVPPVDPPPMDKTAITGRYVRIELDSQPCDIYVEQAGSGHDLLLLHTAGADARQFHGLMSQPELTTRSRLTAFDLPGHGRSDPLPSQLNGTYQLTTDSYATIVIAVADALRLPHPTVCGASMAGQICLELAWRAPARFHSVVACEAAEHVPGRRVAWAKHHLVNQALFVPEWIYGLSAATSPKIWRDHIWWHYSQSGYGTFAGDIAFYSGDFDARDRVTAIDTSRCPVVMMTGEYDYSCTPAMSQATADKIDGAVFFLMPGLGHFPMAENPPLFTTYLSRALDELGV